MKARALCIFCTFCLITVLILITIPAEAEEIILTHRGAPIELSFVVTENPSHAVAAVFELQYDHSALEIISDNNSLSDRLVITGNLHDIPVGRSVQVSFRSKDDCTCSIYQIVPKLLEAYDINEKLLDDVICSNQFIGVDTTQSTRDIAAGLVPGFGMTYEQFLIQFDLFSKEFDSWVQNVRNFDDFPCQNFSDFPLFPSPDYVLSSNKDYFETGYEKTNSVSYNLKTRKLIAEPPTPYREDSIGYGPESSDIAFQNITIYYDFNHNNSDELYIYIEDLKGAYMNIFYRYNSDRTYPDYALSEFYIYDTIS